MTLENPPFSIGKSHLHSWWLFQPVMLGGKKSHFPGLCCPRLWVLEFLRYFIAVVVAILTLLKTNITPESGWLEDDSSYYWEGLFSGDMLGSQRAKFILQNACLTCFLGEDVGSQGINHLSKSLDLGNMLRNNRAMTENPGCLGYIADYTAQLCGDYLWLFHKPWNKDPHETISKTENIRGFLFLGSSFFKVELQVWMVWFFSVGSTSRLYGLTREERTQLDFNPVLDKSY